MRIIDCLAISFIIAFFAFGQGLPGDVTLKISDGGAQRIRIAVLPFVPRTENPTPDEIGIGKKIAETISADLAFSPFFTVLDSEYFPQTVIEESDINPFQWVSAGIQAIVFGSFKLSDGKLKIDARLFSVVSAKRMYRRKLAENQEQLRRIAHAISDDVVKALTGEEGVAQTRIAFISKRTGNKELYLCDYDGFAVQRITYKKSLSFTPDWSPDGQKLTFTCYDRGNSVLFLYEIMKNKFDILSGFQGLNMSASWSPDGRKVAFVMTKDGNSEIYIMDVRTKSLERLTHNYAIDTSPCWSPNGLNIAFCSDRSGSPQIYIMDSEGANVRRLSFEGTFNDQPSWSPRGDRIAFASRTQGHFDIAVIDVTGENLTYLTSIGNNEHPDWAPDGYHIVFCSDRIGTYQIYEMLWDGTQMRRISNSPSDNISPSWSPRYKWNFD